MFTHGKLLNDFAPSSEKSGEFEEPEFAPPPDGFSIAAGVVIQLPDGRVVLTEPAGVFVGYKYAFPKGTKNALESFREAAVRETKEETGLDVRLTGFLGDYRGGSTVTRHYFAEWVGGDPSAADWETDRVHFVPLSQLDAHFSQNERKVLQSVAHDIMNNNRR